MRRAVLDFETRSEVPLTGSTGLGSYLYAKHPSTEILCMSFKLPSENFIRTWHKAYDDLIIAESETPTELFNFIKAGGILEAHNAFFEQCVWHFKCESKGWPGIPLRQWRCSAAKAAAASLPRGLEEACDALRLPISKDMEGNKLMMKMTKPRKMVKEEVVNWILENNFPYEMKTNTTTKASEMKTTSITKARNSGQLPVVYYETDEDIHRLWQYCENDVVAEDLLSNAVPDLSETEQELWFIDQESNWRGMEFDLDLAEKALDLFEKYKNELNIELHDITGIDSATKRAAVKEWLKENEEIDLPNTTADTLKWYVKNHHMSDRASRVFEIFINANKTSVSKYKAMLLRSDKSDNRVRDLLMYHGASTGRWTGKGVQVHNFPARNLIVKDIELAADTIKTGDLEYCKMMYDNIMNLLSHSLRGAIVASPGKSLAVADYSAIEARCVFWLAEAQKPLEMLGGGGDIYCDMAAGIYGHEVNKKDHPEKRQMGKQAILGLGYGMGFVKFLMMCHGYEIQFSQKQVHDILKNDFDDRLNWVEWYLCLNETPIEKRDERYGIRKANAAKYRHMLAEENIVMENVVHELALMKHIVDIYRNRYPEVKAVWNNLELAAVEAVVKNEKRTCGKVAYFMDGDWLCCELPSGRLLRYRDPEVNIEVNDFGKKQASLRYMNVEGTTGIWKRTHTYGGKLLENVSQAMARDIMVAAILNMKDDYKLGMTVHDEIVAEVDENKGNIDEFIDYVIPKDAWLKGLPLDAEGEIVQRYRKM